MRSEHKQQVYLKLLWQRKSSPIRFLVSLGYAARILSISESSWMVGGGDDICPARWYEVKGDAGIEWTEEALALADMMIFYR